MSFIEKYFGKNPFIGDGGVKITEKDILEFIDRKIEENLNLDYKNIDKFEDPDDLSNKIASFANSDGGLLILGISEVSIGEDQNKKFFPDKITWSKSKYKKETLEDRLFIRIKPWIDNLRIYVVRNDIDASKEIYIIDIPKSNNKPHMSKNGFYKRKNFSSDFMDYNEIKNMFMETQILKEKLIENILLPLYGNVDEIIKNINFEKEINTDFYDINLNRKYRYYLDKFENRLLTKKIDDFYEIINKRNNIISYWYAIINNIINNAISNYAKINGYNEPVNNMDVRAIVNHIYNKETEINIPIDKLLLNRQSIDNYIQTNPVIINLIRYKYLIIFKSGEHMELNPIQYNNIWSEILENVNKNLILNSIWSLSQEIIEKGSNLKDNISF